MAGSPGLVEPVRGAIDESRKYPGRVLAARAITISGKTSGIQRNIIGNLTLRLPRE